MLELQLHTALAVAADCDPERPQATVDWFGFTDDEREMVRQVRLALQRP